MTFWIILARFFGRPVSLTKCDPVMRDLDRLEREARRRHHPVKHIQARKYERTHAILRGGAK